MSFTPRIRPRLWSSSPHSTNCLGSVLYRSEEHTSELQSQSNLVCRLLLEKKKKNQILDLTAFILLVRTIAKSYNIYHYNQLPVAIEDTNPSSPPILPSDIV